MCIHSSCIRSMPAARESRRRSRKQSTSHQKSHQGEHQKRNTRPIEKGVLLGDLSEPDKKHHQEIKHSIQNRISEGRGKFAAAEHRLNTVSDSLTTELLKFAHRSSAGWYDGRRFQLTREQFYIEAILSHTKVVINNCCCSRLNRVQCNCYQGADHLRHKNAVNEQSRQ